DSTTYLKGDNSWSSFSNDIFGTILNGFSTASSADVTETDTILDAFGKTQAQLNNKLDLTGGTLSPGAIIDGAPTPVLPTQIVNKQYVDDKLTDGVNQWSESGGNVYRPTGNVGVGSTSPNSKV